MIKMICRQCLDKICADKNGFWINGITQELNYRQRIIGKIKIEDGEIVSSKPSLNSSSNKMV